MHSDRICSGPVTSLISECHACGDFKTNKDSKGPLKACFHVVGTILRVCEVAITITENQVDG